MSDDIIILCQPDDKKGCSVCCGLFNFKAITKDNLSAFLKDYHARTSLHSDNFSQSQYNKRDETSYICPYQGFVNNNSPGCMIHPCGNDDDLRELSLFGKIICDGFLCPAHVILKNDYKKLLIDLIDNWFLYSIAIIDPESFIWMVDSSINKLKENSYRPGTKLLKQIIPLLITKHSEFLTLKNMPLFYYSISEYNQAKAGFSLSTGSENVCDEQHLLSHLIDEVIQQL